MMHLYIVRKILIVLQGKKLIVMHIIIFLIISILLLKMCQRIITISIITMFYFMIIFTITLIRLYLWGKIGTNIRDNFICSANYDNENNQTSIPLLIQIVYQLVMNV